MITTESEFMSALVQLRRDGSDSWNLEVKRASGGTPRLAETLCAFANMPEGGSIIFGLDESTGFAAVGVPDPSALEQGIAAQARQQLDPQVHVQFWRAQLDGKTLVIANVHGLPSHQRPCFLRSSRKAYLRFADGDYVLSEQEIQQMVSVRQRPRHDAAVIDDTTKHDLDPQLTQDFIREARRNSRRLAREDDEQVLRLKRVLEPSGDRLTLAGLYALGNYPQQFLPSLSLTAVLRSASQPEVRNADRQQFDGPLPEILDNAVEWVLRNTRTQIRFGVDGHGYNTPELPGVAVREIIANALVHRDLSQHSWGKDVQLILDHDKLVISNPGGLWGLTTDQLGLGNTKSAVNEFLYDICQLTTTREGHRVIEGEGGGIREVHRALHQVGMSDPQFFDSGVKFNVVLPRRSPISDQDSQSNDVSQFKVTFVPSEIVLEHVPPAEPTLPSHMGAPQNVMEQQAARTSKHGAALWKALQDGQKNIRQLSEKSQLSLAQVRYGMKNLVDAGLVVRSGGQGHRETTYSLRT